MKIQAYIYLLIFLLAAASCGPQKPTGGTAEIDELNGAAFALRYKDIELSKASAFRALDLIEAHQSNYYGGQAQAWNSLAYSHFLTSWFDSTRFYIDKIRNIEPDYPGRDIEEAITYITEARLFLRECKYAEAFKIYDSTLTIFGGGMNRLKYNDFLPLKTYDHQRYNWARSDYLIGNAVLGYYYRDTELPVILKSLDEIRDTPKLHIDTTQLSVLYYTYAGSYERAVAADKNNFDLALYNIERGLDLLENPSSRNDYHLANFYQITGSLLLSRGTRKWMSGPDSTDFTQSVDRFRERYLIGKYGWNDDEAYSGSLPLILLEKADSLFRRYDDPYQNLASSLHIGNYHLFHNDTLSASAYYARGMECDSVIKARGGYARIWTQRLYHILLKYLAESYPPEEVHRWYNTYSEETAVIAENTKRDYDAQRGKSEAEEKARRSLFYVFLIMSVCVTAMVLVYFLNRQNRKLKKARSVLGLRNEELEENRIDLELLAKIGKHVVSTLEIDDDSRKTEFVNGIYAQIKQLKILAALPDLSFILYVRNDNKGLQRYCKEGDRSPVDISTHTLSDVHRPAVGCFVKFERDVLTFGDWKNEYRDYADMVGLEGELIDPDRTISGNSTRSLAFINLYGKKGDKIGVLSFQTTEPDAFKKPMLLATFEIIAEYVAAALDNAMQYKELRFVQKRLIEQKRMELLTYVVRGISHELSQPLGSITQTLYDTFKDVERLGEGSEVLPEGEYESILENLRADLVTISQSKDAISDLVNSFRNTIKENIMDPETEFNLSAKLEDIIKVVRPTVKSNVNLVAECDPDLVVRTFPLLLSQVLTNLISNAAQHAFPDSDSPDDNIRIVCETSGKNLIIMCIDNGIGVPESELDRLCQPFVSKKQSNLGLGLSLVKNIVEQYMKGEVYFSSGDGLTVTVVIPDCVIDK